ncbi:MAG: histidine kinase [Lewinellaceae bacterium]|nr:histidine kinase [Lewinellaceae bacterium]
MKSIRTLLCVLLPATLLSAQQPLRFAPAFRNYTTDHGLPNNWVYDIYQDHTGYLWIATDHGVCRFDGYTFKQFPDTLNTNLTSVLTGAMAEDSLGRIWYVDFQSRVFYIENDTIRPYPYNHIIAQQKGATDIFHALYVAGAGSELWLVARANGGVLHLWGNGQYDRIPLPRQREILVFEKNGKSQYALNNRGNAFPAQITVRQHSDGKSDSLVLPYPPENRLLGGYWVKKLHNGRYILYIAGQLYLLQHQTILWMRPGDTHPLSLLEEPDGSLLVGYLQDGLVRYRSLDDLRANRKESHWLQGLTVSQVLRDREGGYWIGTQQEGVFYSPGLNSAGTAQIPLFEGRTIKAVTSNGAGGLFVGTEDAHVAEIDLSHPERPTWKQLPHSGSLFLNSLHYDAPGRTLALAGNPAAFYVSGHWKTYSYTINGFGQSRLLSSNRLSPTGKPGQWLSASPGQLTRFSLDKPNVWVDLTNSTYQTIIRFRSVFSAPDGRVWASRNEGLFEWKGGSTLVRPDVEHPAFLQPFIGMDVLPDGSLVFGPKGHGVVLWKLGENAVTEIKQADGLLSNKVYAVHVAPNGVIWAGTHSGLNRLTPVGPRRYRVDNFTVKHGLPSNTVNDVRTTPDGSVWVATAKGLFRFREKPGEAPIPAPLFEQVTVHGVAYAAATLHTLPHDSADLVVKFLSLHFRSGGDIPYRFRLLQAGGDSAWTHTHSQTVNFSSLAPGAYRFQTQAQNEEGRWSAVSTLTFTIRPPWWATWWARVAGATALGALAFAGYRYRIGEIQKASKLREELYRLEQSALQAQMNPHFIFNCLNSIQHFILKNETDAAVLYLARFAKLVRTALNASVNGTVTLAEEVAMLDNYLALEQMRFQKTFDYTIAVDDALDGRHTLLPPLLVQPFVENAVLHGMKAIKKDGHIGVTFRQADGYLCVTIQDNGPGLPKEQLETEGKISLGGQITQRRLELLRQGYSGQAAHTVVYGQPENGTGTVVTLRIPPTPNSKLKTQNSKLTT